MMTALEPIKMVERFGSAVMPLMEQAGLPRDRQFVTGVKAVVDETVFPEATSGEGEDHGRAAAWHAYGAWKPESQEAAQPRAAAH